MILFIVNALGVTLLREVMTEAADCPRKMWMKIKSRFAFMSDTAHLAVVRNIANKKSQPGGSIMIYMVELNSLYYHFKAMRETTSDQIKTSKLLKSVLEDYERISAALSTQVSDK